MNGLALYRAATTIAGPLVRLYLARRRARGREDTERFGERLGRPGRPRPEGRLAWLHAASVGESLSLLPLIDRLRAHRPDVAVLVTTGTVTSAKLMADRLPAGALHQFVPVDRMAYVRPFLDHWRPDVVLWAESEFWPNLILETASRGTPLVLVNGRISSRSFARWQRYPATIARILSAFPLCLAQTEEDAARLRPLGARSVACYGNLKFAAPPLPADDAALANLRNRIGNRPCWLAASTHPGEEEVAGECHRRIASQVLGALTVIVPRHPERAAAVTEALRGSGLTVAQRSSGALLTPETELYVADTMGEMGLFYRLAAVAFIGKSLAGRGGQNPLEPAHLDCAIVHGPHMDNFAEIAKRMADAGAAVEVADANALAETVAHLLRDAEARSRLADAAQAFAVAQVGVGEAVAEAVLPLFPPPAEGAADAGA